MAVQQQEYYYYDPPYYPPPHPHPVAEFHPYPYNNHHTTKNSSINTLFVAGLPDDVKPREIHNLFRRRPGFDYCQLKYTGRGNQVVAFAIFVDHHSAMEALHAMNGVKFDPETGHILKIELARSNSTRVHKRGEAYVVIDNRKERKRRRKDLSRDDENNESDGSAGTNETDGDDRDVETTKSAKAVGDEENVEAVKNTEKAANGACSTLFIANLGPRCSEAELELVLSRYSGFKVVSVRAKGGMPVAFADFEDVEQATAAMDALQGTLLPSSDRGGTHIEYARSKMRKR